MKNITNWRNATVSDIEANGLEDATKIHCLCCQLANDEAYQFSGNELEDIKDFFTYHIDNNIPVVFHNGILYDIPTVERILDIDLSELMVIDTLILSWYLNHDRDVHGLDSFFPDYGIRKVDVEDNLWDFKPKNKKEEEWHYDLMIERCTVDVDINKALWDDLKGQLIDMYTTVYQLVEEGHLEGLRVSTDEIQSIDDIRSERKSADDYIDALLSYLMFKMDCVALQEATRWKVDIERLELGLSKLSPLLEEAQKELGSVMPKVPKYAKRKPPAEPFKMNGQLSVAGTNWNNLIDKVGTKDDLGNIVAYYQDDGTIKELNKYEEPNINSPQQIKDWLFSHGWKPKSFKFVKDKEKQQIWADSGFKSHLKPKPRAIPQISVDGDEGKELCRSVLELAERIPEIKAYDKYTTIKHRYDFLLGMQRNLSDDGYLKARIKGVTNTNRMRHKELVNLPKPEKDYAEDIRASLVADEGEILLGSDLSSLEDRIKNHFCLPIDPDYVKSVSDPDYDPHGYMAMTAGMITEQEYVEATKQGIKSDNYKEKRPLGKTANYSCVYGAGPPTIASSTGMPLAEAKALHKAYWEIHNYVKEIAANQILIESKQGDWLINPINGFCYSVRSEKDIFSTLIQGTGAYCFDMWLDNILQLQYNKWEGQTLTGQFHDEFIACFWDTPEMRRDFEEITLEAIERVNTQLHLRVPLGCSMDFGKSYADIH